MTVDPQHRYSNESERADKDIYDDFELNKTLSFPCFIRKIFSALTLSSLTLHHHLHPLQAANSCRNSRLVVDEDDLMWIKN